jgi:hypothetical protein
MITNVKECRINEILDTTSGMKRGKRRTNNQTCVTHRDTLEAILTFERFLVGNPVD